MTWFFVPPRPRWWDRFRRGKRVPAGWQDIGYLVEEPATPDNGERYSARGEVPDLAGLPLTLTGDRCHMASHFVRLPFEVDPDMLDALGALFSQGVSYLLSEGANLTTIRAQVETDLSDGSWHLTMRGNS